MPQFVAVSSTTSTLVTSTDGNSWAVRGVPRASTFTGVASNGSITIAAGLFDAIKSTDGINWSDSELVIRLPFKTVWGSTKGYAINSLGNLVIISGSGSTAIADAAFTTDGIHWQGTYLPTKGVAWQAVASKGQEFVAITNSAPAAKSTDGITWTSMTMPSLSYTDIKASPSMYVAIATGTNQYVTSTDAITWTTRTLPASSTWNSLWYNGSVFCATTTNAGIGARSTDGITWTQTTLPSALSWNVVNWTGTEFIIIRQGAASVTAYASSTDGITWTNKAFPTAGAYLSVETNSTRTFWLATTTTSAALSSTDGNTWSYYSYPSSIPWTTIWYKNKFLSWAANSSGGTTVTDTLFNITSDGAAWYPTGAGGSSYKIRYINNMFVSLTLTQGSYPTVITSTDGIQWNTPTKVTTSSFIPYDIAYGNGMYVIVGPAGNVYRSTDLTTWSQCTTSASGTMNGVTYGNGLFVAVGNVSKIIYSTDAITWGTATAAIASRTIQNIIYTGTIFIAVDNAGSIHRSIDGISWISTFTNPGSNALYSSCYSPALNEVVSVGVAGIILNSTT